MFNVAALFTVAPLDHITAYIPILKSTFHLTMGVFLKYMIILELGEMPVLMICLS